MYACTQCSNITFTAIHGLQTPNEAFFYWNPELLSLGKQIGQIKSGAFGVLSAKLSAPILVQWVPCPCFPLFNHDFYKKLTPCLSPLHFFSISKHQV